MLVVIPYIKNNKGVSIYFKSAAKLRLFYNIRKFFYKKILSILAKMLPKIVFFLA